MVTQLPLWLTGICLFLLLIGSLEAGFRMARGRRSEDEKQGSDFLASATLGLLALLLGFTFSLALQRHEERRALVIAEANALSTSWLRIQAIDPADRDKIIVPFRRYAEARLQWSLSSDEGENSHILYVQSQSLQDDIWSAVTAALANGETIVDAKVLLDPLNEAFDLAAEREVRRLAHLPMAMLAMLLLFMVCAAALVGWRLGEAGRRLSVPSALTIFLLSLTAVITLDLDMSRGGSITVSQAPMESTVRVILAKARSNSVDAP